MYSLICSETWAYLCNPHPYQNIEYSQNLKYRKSESSLYSSNPLLLPCSILMTSTTTVGEWMMLPVFCYYEWNCYEHSCSRLYCGHFYFSWSHTQEWVTGMMCNFKKSLPNPVQMVIPFRILTSNKWLFQLFHIPISICWRWFILILDILVNELQYLTDILKSNQNREWQSYLISSSGLKQLMSGSQADTSWLWVRYSFGRFFLSADIRLFEAPNVTASCFKTEAVWW